MGDADSLQPPGTSSEIINDEAGPTEEEGGVKAEPDAVALSDILHLGDANDGSFQGGQYCDDDDSDGGGGVQDDGDLSPSGGNSYGRRRFRRVDTPLRVEPPPSFNAPARPVDQTQEQQIKASAFSPAAFTMRKHDVPSQGLLGSKDSTGGSSTTSLLGGLRQRQDPSIRGHSENQASYRTAMSDYHMLAFSSQRSGRHEMEGLALYSAGVTMDSMGQYPKAMESYRKFLAVCKELKDPFMEGVCHNCMGVDYMLMACPPGSNTQINGALTTAVEDNATVISTRAVSLLEKAMEHHEEHLKGADDAGSGVAHSNMGLCLGLIGDYPRAAKHHQEALRVALRVQSASAQSVAVGNLATLAMRQGDSQTAQACLEQHLQLTQQLGDWQGEINAWSKMAQLAAAAAGGKGQSDQGASSSAAIAEGFEAEHDGGADGAGVGGINGGNSPRGIGRGAAAAAAAAAAANDAVARALWCFEKAAALAKTHNKVSTLKRLHCDMGVVRGNASMDDYFRSLGLTALG